MYLEFQYGAAAPGIEQDNNYLKLKLINEAMGPASERWALPAGNYTKRGDFHLLESRQYVLGAASISIRPETLAAATDSLYEQFLDSHPAHSLCRIWHFVPGINKHTEDGLENYRAFCVGRTTAFERHAGDARHPKMPAASAVGTKGSHLGLVYLAGRSPSRHIENPRQTPAYHYPEAYGPKPPAFARATSVDFAGRPTLFISGTASILASESIGNTVEKQLATTLENLRLVAAQTPIPIGSKRRVRVYLRHARDYDYVKAQLEPHYLNEGDEVYYIQAEICRRELLVEIEVTIGL